MGGKSKTLAYFLTLILIMSCLTFAIKCASAQTTQYQTSDLNWSKTYGYFSGVSIVQASDKALVVAGLAGTDYYYAGHMTYDYKDRAGVLLKLNLNGNIGWRKQLPLEPKTMIETQDAGYAVAGSIRESLGSDTMAGSIYTSYISLAKMDSQGNLFWQKTYESLTLPPLTYTPFPNISYIMPQNGVAVYSLAQTSDGGFILGGTSDIDYDYKAWLMKTDPSGNMLWINYYGSGENYANNNQNSVQSVVEATDGGFLWTGYLNGAVIAKTDSSGTLQWTKIYENTSFTSMSKTNGGDYIFAGCQGINPRLDYSCAYATKLDSSFNIVWNKTYANTDTYFKATSCSDDGYLFAGYSYLIKTDFDGNTQWTYQIKNCNINSAVLTMDKGCALTGDTVDAKAAEITDDKVTDILVGKITAPNQADTTSNPANTLTPTISPSIPELNFSVALLLLLSLFCVAVVLKHRKTADISLD